MITTTLKLENYTEEVIERNGKFYKYIHPVFKENDEVTVFELSFDTYPTEEMIENYKNSHIKLHKRILLSKIEEYDKSENVREFIFNDSPTWILVDLRNNMKSAIQDAITLESSTITLGINGTPYTFEVEKAKLMFAYIEQYALSVNNNTLNHINAVNQLDDFDAIIEYDYTKNYPEKVAFDINGNLL